MFIVLTCNYLKIGYVIYISTTNFMTRFKFKKHYAHQKKFNGGVKFSFEW